MSDLWDRCRSALKDGLSPEDFRRSIEPLRAWVAGDVIHLWVERDAGDWRSIPNPARDFDAEIRESMRRVSGRPPREIRYLARPPNREDLISERRRIEHRKTTRADQDRSHKLLLQYAMEECRRLEADPPQLGPCRSDAERLVKLRAIVMDRAKRRLEARALSAGSLAGRRVEPPRSPPPSPQPEPTAPATRPRLAVRS